MLGVTGQASALCALMAFATHAYLVLQTAQNGSVRGTPGV
jgi:hypothetical protein